MRAALLLADRRDLFGRLPRRWEDFEERGWEGQLEIDRRPRAFVGKLHDLDRRMRPPMDDASFTSPAPPKRGRPPSCPEADLTAAPSRNAARGCDRGPRYTIRRPGSTGDAEILSDHIVQAAITAVVDEGPRLAKSPGPMSQGIAASWRRMNRPPCARSRSTARPSRTWLPSTRVASSRLPGMDTS